MNKKDKNKMKQDIYCSVCANINQENCDKEDVENCKNFKMKQDNTTWYLEGNSGIRHPLDMD